jgi:hypothetical protein
VPTQRFDRFLIFYGLMQGAFALSAARTKGDSWQFKEGHGLRVSCPRVKSEEIQSLDKITVEVHGKGGIQVIAETLGSPVADNAVSSEELALSLPNSDDFLLESKHPSPVQVTSAGDVFFQEHRYRTLRLTLGPVPEDMAEKMRHSATPSSPRYTRPTTKEALAWLASYPKLRKLGEPSELPEVTPDPTYLDSPEPHPLLLGISWTLHPEMKGSEVDHLVRSFLTVDHTRVGAPISGIISPRVGGNFDVQHPLIAWWMLLFGFSTSSGSVAVAGTPASAIGLWRG